METSKGGNFNQKIVRWMKRQGLLSYWPIITRSEIMQPTVSTGEFKTETWGSEAAGSTTKQHLHFSLWKLGEFYFCCSRNSGFETLLCVQRFSLRTNTCASYIKYGQSEWKETEIENMRGIHKKRTLFINGKGVWNSIYGQEKIKRLHVVIK